MNPKDGILDFLIQPENFAFLLEIEEKQLIRKAKGHRCLSFFEALIKSELQEYECKNGIKLGNAQDFCLKKSKKDHFSIVVGINTSDTFCSSSSSYFKG